MCQVLKILNLFLFFYWCVCEVEKKCVNSEIRYARSCFSDVSEDLGSILAKIGEKIGVIPLRAKRVGR